MASKPYTVRWGILATGWIATTFTKDLLTDPATRDVHDIKHVVAAAASSSSASRAQSFLKDIKAPSEAKAYGSYAELVADPDIDIIYVATPHSHHFQNAMLALEAGKHVLCEKAFTVNAKQTKILIDTAREKKLFLMEAVWTRYFPLSIKVRESVKSGVIGKVHRVSADFSIPKAKDDGDLEFADTNRMVNLDLAGGALLDLGIYSLTWVFQILYHCQEEAEKEKPKVLASVNKYERTGGDEQTNMFLQFPGHRSTGIATTSLRVATAPEGEDSLDASPAARIQGTKGEIQIIGSLCQPRKYRILKNNGGTVEDVHCPIPKDKNREGETAEGWGHGMFWEADEAARCLRDGRLESEGLPWEESLLIMETMDEVRRQGDLKYPELIESAVYDAKSELNGKA